MCVVCVCGMRVGSLCAPPHSRRSPEQYSEFSPVPALFRFFLVLFYFFDHRHSSSVKLKGPSPMPMTMQLTMQQPSVARGRALAAPHPPRPTGTATPAHTLLIGGFGALQRGGERRLTETRPTAAASIYMHHTKHARIRIPAPRRRVPGTWLRTHSYAAPFEAARRPCS